MFPLLLAAVPPLVDYPNHLARMWILVHGDDIPALASNYVAQWRLLPNLAMDLVVPTLSMLMPVETAGRVFIAMTMGLLVGGTATLHYSLFGKPSLWPAVAVFFVYNMALFWGFLNYLFAAGLYLFVFSGWVASRGWNPFVRVVLFSALGCCLLFLHLFAFGLYGLSVAYYELARRIENRGLTWPNIIGWCGECLQFVPPLLALGLSLPDGVSVLTRYGSLDDKLRALVGPTTFGVEPTLLDQFHFALVCVFLVCAVAGRWLHIARVMRLPLLALTVAALAMPNWLSGSWAADMRLPVMLPFILIASTQVRVPRSRLFPVFIAGAVILFVLRVDSVAQTWRDYDQRFGEFRAAARVLPLGSRLLIVMNELPEAEREVPGVSSLLAVRHIVTWTHLPSLAVIDRAVFIPYLFSGWTPIEPTARNRELSVTQGHPITPTLLAESGDPEQAKKLYTGPNFLGQLPYWRDWPRHFDYVLWVDFGSVPASIPNNLESVESGSFFHFYRVIRPVVAP